LVRAGNPIADGLLLAGPEQSMLGDMLDGGTGRDLEDGGGPFPDIGFGVMIAGLDQFRLLDGREGDMMGARHRSNLQGGDLHPAYPIRGK
jgi:hypothetical protein